MKIKQIKFTEPYKAEFLDEELPTPAYNEVQIKIMVSTISSGTERANLIGEKNVTIGETPIPFPRISGYSSSGIVTALGENVTEFKIGDRVAMSWTTHSSVINLKKNQVYKIPNNMSFNNAALLHISTFPMAAIRKCHLEIGESAIIMGMGVLGLMAIPLLKAAGATPVIAVDPVAEKREKALKVGADYALDPTDDNFVKTVKELTNGGANVGIEVTGIGAGLDGILDCMAQFGRVALLGCTRNKDFSIDYYKKVHGPGITLVGAHTLARPVFESSNGWWTLQDDANTFIKLVNFGRIDLSNMVDEIHSPKEASKIYTRLANEKAFPVVQFDWSEIN